MKGKFQDEETVNKTEAQRNCLSQRMVPLRFLCLSCGSSDIRNIFKLEVNDFLKGAGIEGHGELAQSKGLIPT